MNVSPQELSLINALLQIDNEWKARTFSISDLKIGMDIFTQIKKCVVDDHFVDWSIKLSTEQKVFLMKLIEAQNFTVLDAEFVFLLKSKII